MLPDCLWRIYLQTANFTFFLKKIITDHIAYACLLLCFSLARYLIWPFGSTFAFSMCSLSRSGVGSSSFLLVFVNKNLLEDNYHVPLNIVFGVLCPTVAVLSNCSGDIWLTIRKFLLSGPVPETICWPLV